MLLLVKIPVSMFLINLLQIAYLMHNNKFQTSVVKQPYQRWS